MGTAVLATELQNPTKIRVQLRFDHQFQFAGFYAAKWLGFYEQAGLEVEIIDGIDEQGRHLDVTEVIGKGDAEFGIGSSDILLAQDAGQDLVIVSSIMQQSPVAVFLRNNPQVTSPAQLEGLRIQSSQNKLVDVEIEEMFRAVGLAPDRIDLIHYDTLRPIHVHLQDFFSGKVDGTLGYIFSIAWMAEQRNFPLQIMRPSSYGVDFYGDSVFTTRRFLESHRDLVDRFVSATNSGWDYAFRNQDSVIAHIVNDWPASLITSDRIKYNQFLAGEMRRLMLFPAVKPGYINRQRWQYIADVLLRAGIIKNPLSSQKFVYIESEYKLQQKERREWAIVLTLILVPLLATISVIIWFLIQRRRHQQEKLRRVLFLDEALTGILTCDAHQKIVEFNAAAEELTGWPRHEAMGQTMSHLLFHDSEPMQMVGESEDQVEKTSSMNRVSIAKNREVSIQHKDGHAIPVMMSLVEFKLGRETFFTASFADLTQIKTLAMEKSRLARIIESSEDLIFVFNRRGEIVYGNPAFSQITGYRSTGDSGKACVPLSRYLASANTQQQVDQVLENLDKQGSFHATLNIQDYEGRILTASVAFFTQLMPSRHIEYVGIARDITLLLEAQRQLRVFEQRFRCLFASPIIGIAIRSRTSPLTIIEANERILEIMGFDREEFKRGSIPWERILYPADGVSGQSFLKPNSMDQEFFEVKETELQRKDGSMVAVMLGKVQLSPEDDASAMLLAIDVTDRVRIAKEKERLLAHETAVRQNLESLNRLKDEFLITLSHELRTPLTAVLGWTDYLLQRDIRSLDQDVCHRALSIIKRNTLNEVKLIDDLLDVSRIVSGKLSLDLSVHDAETLVLETIESLKHAADAKSIRIEYQNNAGLSQIRCDLLRFKQVLWNILGNAIKFTPTGGSIVFLMERDDDRLRLICQDSGIGVDPKFIDRIFDRFAQDDSSMTRKFGGLGLGLAICKNIVELHGGSIQISSPGRGQGTQVTVEWPLLPVEHIEQPVSTQQTRHDASQSGRMGQGTLDGVSILIIEDDVSSLEIMATILRSVGATVETATTGHEGLTKLKLLNPNVLLCDIGLPDQTGYEIVSQLRKSNDPRLSSTPAAAVTAFVSPSFQVQAMTAGFQEYVTKPLSPTKLVSVVHDLLKKAG
jgi:PAS domain S-box-containing protein